MESGTANLSVAMEEALQSLQRANEQAEMSIVETGQWRRRIDDGARAIEASQFASRKAIEDLVNG